jgi:hypothetical protein
MQDTATPVSSSDNTPAQNHLVVNELHIDEVGGKENIFKKKKKKKKKKEKEGWGEEAAFDTLRPVSFLGCLFLYIFIFLYLI